MAARHSTPPPGGDIGITNIKRLHYVNYGRGLLLRARGASGVWIARWRIGSRVASIELGDFPQTTVEEARASAVVVRKLVARAREKTVRSAPVRRSGGAQAIHNVGAGRS